MNNESESVNSEEKIFKTHVNSFYYLYKDAEYLHYLAKSMDKFEKVQFSRTALLLYILSLEALINMIMDRLLTDNIRNFLIEREDKLSILD